MFSFLFSYHLQQMNGAGLFDVDLLSRHFTPALRIFEVPASIETSQSMELQSLDSRVVPLALPPCFELVLGDVAGIQRVVLVIGMFTHNRFYSNNLRNVVQPPNR